MEGGNRKEGPEVAVLEACQYAPYHIQKQALTSSLLPVSCIAGAQEHFSTVNEHNLGTHSTMSSSKPGLPSQRMLPRCSSLVTGMTSPLSTSKSVHLSQPVPVDKVSEQSHTSHGRSSYNCYQEGTASKVAAALTGVYSNSDPSEAAVVATLAYARMQSEQGFPYGISGVAMPSYNYGSELYNYASNGFPRKSRICSYCSKVFTRSTTRRYHERRCPVHKAKGSLEKGSSDTSGTSIATTAGTGSSGDDGISSSGSLNIPSHPPPLLTMNRESPSPLLNPSTSSAVSTSLGMSVLSNTHKLNSIYSAYGSQSVYSNVPVTSTSSAHNSSPASVAGSSSNVDQNRNSVLSSIKLEPGSLVNFHVAGAAPDFSLACSPSTDLNSVNSKALTRAEYGQHLFSTLSTASLSPSNGSHSVEDDVESDAAEDLTVRPAKSAYNSSLAVGNGTHEGSNPTSGKSFFLNNYTYNNPSQPLSQENYKLFWGSQVTHASALELDQKPADISFDRDGNSFREDKGDARYDCNPDPRGMDYGASSMDVEGYSSIPEKQCGICKQQFDSSSTLHGHMQVHQKYSPNSCHICGQRFLRTSMRMAHERIHNVENPFCCVVCGLYFARKFALRQHIVRQHVKAHDRMPVACRHCKKSVSSLIHLHQHLLTHNIPQQERTSLLYLRFATSRNLSPLKEEVAPKLPPSLSVESRASDDSPAMLSEPPPLIQMRPSPTSVAGSEESILTNGTNTPSGARDMEWCRLCDKEYPKSFMRFHEKAHADQKPYECPTCKKRFGYKNNMKSHIKLHAGIKPYHCHICGAKFTRGSTLRRHARRHGGNTETIWDMFVSNGKAAQQSSLANRRAVLNQAHDTNITLPSSEGQVQTASRVTPGAAQRAVRPRSRTRKPVSSGVSIGSCDALPSGKSFDVRGFSSPSLPQNLFASYQGLPAVTQSLYPPYMATAQFLNYASGLSAASSVQQDIQSDALNLSLPDKQRRSTSSLGTFSQDQILSAVGHSQGPVYHPTIAADGASSSCHDLISDDEDIIGKVSTMMEKSMPGDLGHVKNHKHVEGNSPSMLRSQATPMAQDSHSNIKPLCSSNAKDNGTQVTLCCSHIMPVGKNADTLGGDCSENGPLDMSASSPSRIGSSALEGLQHETIAMLMTAGKLFRCPYCDCYFTDYTMYHVHQKLHQPDQPFTCNTCGENCRDKVYFSLHIYDHLR